MNLFICGVGGQGIGLLTEALGRACLKAGHEVRGCDTHGLAQRGGVVASHLRLGEKIYTPRVPPGQADGVIALERLEALRGARRYLRPGGWLLFYDSVYQPVSVRTASAKYPGQEELEAIDARLERVWIDDLSDARMQNVALLGRLAGLALIPGIDVDCMRDVLKDVTPAKALEANLAVFEKATKLS
ncbi:MAG: 2-oxoacid:acceptor oxidoreductase family protein [Deltaproteobacteria bacterium]|nr:2-oxoacid:acceptor oxidoreductase family protein [Deltaproteobacteria bacterium]